MKKQTRKKCEHEWAGHGHAACLCCRINMITYVERLEQQIDEVCEILEVLYNIDVENKREIIDRIFIKFGKRNKTA